MNTVVTVATLDSVALPGVVAAGCLHTTWCTCAPQCRGDKALTGASFGLLTLLLHYRAQAPAVPLRLRIIDRVAERWVMAPLLDAALIHPLFTNAFG